MGYNPFDYDSGPDYPSTFDEEDNNAEALAERQAEYRASFGPPKHRRSKMTTQFPMPDDSPFDDPELYRGMNRPAFEPSDNPAIWTTANGKRIPVRHMGTDHLVNSAAMVWRWLMMWRLGVTQAMPDHGSEELFDEDMQQRRLEALLAEIHQRMPKVKKTRRTKKTR